MQFEAPWDEYDRDPSTLTSSAAWNALAGDLTSAGVPAYMGFSAEIHLE